MTSGSNAAPLPVTSHVSLVVATVVWMAAQARAHMKAKLFYIDPDSEKSGKSEKAGSSS